MKKYGIIVAAALCFLTYALHGSDEGILHSIVLSAGASVVLSEIDTLDFFRISKSVLN